METRLFPSIGAEFPCWATAVCFPTLPDGKIDRGVRAAFKPRP